MGVESSRVRERLNIRKTIAKSRSLMDKVVGSFHDYALSRYQELRFGAAVEGAFDIVRSEVDSRLGTLVPEALPMLAAAFENATSTNSEAGRAPRLRAAGSSRLSLTRCVQRAPKSD